jgi:hypothetical protein
MYGAGRMLYRDGHKRFDFRMIRTVGIGSNYIQPWITTM